MDHQSMKLIYQYTNLKRMRVLLRLVKLNLRKMNRRQKLALVLLLLLSRRRRQRNRTTRANGPPTKIRRIDRTSDNVESDSGSSTSSYDSSRSSLSSSTYDEDLVDETTANSDATSIKQNESLNISDLKQEDVDPDLAELVAFDMRQGMAEIKPENDVHDIVGDEQKLNEYGVITSMTKPSMVKKEEEP